MKRNQSFHACSIDWGTSSKLCNDFGHIPTSLDSNDDSTNLKRAQNLMNAAEHLDFIGRDASELQWRVDIESLVYDRFKRHTYCPSCSGRLWEAIVLPKPEVPGPITDDSMRASCKLHSCHCGDLVLLQTQTKIIKPEERDFCCKIDEFVNYNRNGHEPHFNSGPDTTALRKQKPDLVYGISRKNRTKCGDCGHLAVKKSLFHGEPEPYFPFLVSEAKHSDGNSFLSCQIQTAFPLWEMLRLQDELQLITGTKLTEQGGPLVWFFANRGADWNVYGCYTQEDLLGKTAYNVCLLWSGCIAKFDDALQLVVIVDYIFDWACNIYLPSISHLVNIVQSLAISNEQPREVLQGSIFGDGQVISRIERQDVPPCVEHTVPNDTSEKRGSITSSHESDLEKKLSRFEGSTWNPPKDVELGIASHFSKTSADKMALLETIIQDFVHEHANQSAKSLVLSAFESASSHQGREMSVNLSGAETKDSLSPLSNLIPESNPVWNCLMKHRGLHCCIPSVREGFSRPTQRPPSIGELGNSSPVANAEASPSASRGQGSTIVVMDDEVRVVRVRKRKGKEVAAEGQKRLRRSE